MNNRDQLLTDWKAANEALAAAKAREAELRPLVIEAFSDVTDEMASGIENIDVGYGYTLKVDRKLNYSLASANDYEAVDNAADAIGEILDGDFGETIVNRLFKRKFEISVTEYKKILELPNGAKIKAIVDKILTIKPAAPSVKLEPPKTKK